MLLRTSLLLVVWITALGLNVTAAASSIKHVIADKDRIRIYDGDTIAYKFKWRDGVKNDDGTPYSGTLRLLGYDTPEKFMPPLGMYYDQPYGQEASWFLKRLIRNASKIEIYTKMEKGDKNRVLAHVMIDGKLLAAEMVRWGLAYESVIHFGDNGFPDFAKKVVEAWKGSPLHRALARGETPRFIEPYIWRKLNLHIENKMQWNEWGALSSAEKNEVKFRARELADQKRKELLKDPKYRDRLRYPLPQPF